MYYLEHFRQKFDKSSIKTKRLPGTAKWIRAVTLAELLLVLVIIFVLAAILLPTNPHHGPTSRIMRARLEMADLVPAIQAYEADYARLPLADYSTNGDITFGISPTDLQGFQKIRGTSLVESNSALIIVLMDNNSGVNADHKLNPKKIEYFNAKVSNDTNSPGVGVDCQYRDPWGNPFVISLDANQDGFVRDALYSSPSLYATNSLTPLTNTHGLYELRGTVMVWSRGPDGKASFTVPAKSGVNKDNVLSWE